MKQIYFLISAILFFGSCSNDDMGLVIDTDEILKMDNQGQIMWARSYYDSILDTIDYYKINSMEERIEAFQISTKTLKSLPSNILVELCQNYPLLDLMPSYNSQFHGLLFLMRQNNPYKVLIERSDASECMLSYAESAILLDSDYEAISPVSYSPIISSTQMEYLIDLCASGDFKKMYTDSDLRARLINWIDKLYEADGLEEGLLTSWLQAYCLIMGQIEHNGALSSDELYAKYGFGL